jgi:arylsulfatase A-like enzyme
MLHLAPRARGASVTASVRTHDAWRRGRCARRAAALLALVALLCACGAPEEPTSPEARAKTQIRPQTKAPRLVVLYAVCTVNKHYLQPYNDSVSYTPHLARFGAESAVLESHRTESGVSGTAYASIFSGTQADRHGVFKHPHVLDENLYLIFEAFRDAGYGTAYWAAHPMARPDLGYAQGLAPRNIINRPLKGDDSRFRTLLKRVRDNPERRLLVVTAFSVTHSPWNLDDMPAFRASFPDEVPALPRKEFQRLFGIFKHHAFALQTNLPETARRLNLQHADVERLGGVLDTLYKSKINVLDAYFGSVVEAVDSAGLRDESVIAFTADHGEQMDVGELFRWIHGPDLAPDVIDVPWLIRGPGLGIEPRAIDAVTRSIDVYPTLAGLSGFEIPANAGVAGANLAPALRELDEFPALTAYSHGTLRQWSFFQPDLIENIWATARTGDNLYTWRHPNDGWSFDAQRVEAGRVAQRLDPDELQHQSAERDLWQYRMNLIDAFRAANPDEAQTKGEELHRLNEADADALRALGYIE